MYHKDKLKRFVSEVDIKVAPMDIVIANEVWVPFFKMFSHILSIHIPPSLLESNPSSSEKSSGMWGMGMNNNTLPLVYVKAKTIRILLLTKSKECRNPDKIDLNHAALNPDMLIFKCDSISITPQVENMLSRILVHPELFHLSRAILSIPGSYIEDRQYQFDAVGLGLFTGRWCDIERKSEKRPKPVLKAMGENPALEWNDGTITNEMDKKVDEVFLMPCVAPFDVQVTFAPAIVYQTITFQDNSAAVIPMKSEKLIAGMSLEINAKSEIIFSTSLNQISLMSLFVQESITIYNSLLYPLASGGMPYERKVPDSGLDGDDTSDKPKEELVENLDTEKSSYPNIVPSELLITGSKISFILFKLIEGNKSGATKEDKAMWRKYRYKQRRLEIMKDRKEEYPLDLESEEAFNVDTNRQFKLGDQFPSDSNQKCDIGYEASEEGSIEEASDLIVKIYPLLCYIIKQPHMFMSYTTSSRNRFEISVYDANLSMPPVNYFITCGGHRVPGTLDYQNQIFQTKPGENHPKSGIPPALITISAKDFLDPNFAAITCQIERPIKVHCNISLWKQLFDVLFSIKESCGMSEIVQLLNIMEDKQNNTKEDHINPDVENDAFEQMLMYRKYLSNVKEFSIETKQIVASMATIIHQKISQEEKEDFAKVCLAFKELEMKCKILSKPIDNVRLSTDVEFNATLNNILCRVSIGSYCHRFLDPSTLELGFNASWLGNKIEEEPSFIIKVIADTISIHVGPNHILSLRRISKYLEENFGNVDKTVLEKIETSKTIKTVPNVIKRKEDECVLTQGNIGINETQETHRLQVHEQNYVDDLRAGAFQYLDIKNGSECVDEPKPYQVIFTENPPAMTWKYPQPRTLTRVSIFPVPFMSASEFGSTNTGDEQEVSCALQFYDKSSNSYRTYSEFNLSEQNVSHLDLPLAKDLKKMVMASTWRVILDYHNEYEEFDQLERQIIVTPKSLVSVIRVDSYVNQNLVPRIQTSLSVSQLALHIHNHLHFCGYSLPFSSGPKFNLDQVFPLDQKVCTLRLDSTNCIMECWSSGDWLHKEHQPKQIQLKGTADTQFQIEYLDYSFLASHFLLLPCKLHLKYFVTKTSDLPLAIEAEMHGKKAFFRAGHFFGRMFSITKDIWEGALENFDSTSSKSITINGQKRALIPMTDYVICNNTQESIRFGQADTEENILLRPSEAHMYAWRSQRTRLQLRLCVEGLGYWRWCESFELSNANANDCKTMYRSIDHGTHITTLVITLKKMDENGASCNQFRVLISGLISTTSLLRDHLEVRAVLHKHGAALAAAATVSSASSHDHPQQQHRTILGSFCAAPSFLLQPEYVQGIKIRLLGIGTPWSGDIPLNMEKGRRNSVLVRVPLKEKGQCLTIWCRLVEESIQGGATRCLLIFSPMYMSRSLLPNPISLLVYLASNADKPSVSSFDALKDSNTFSYEVTLPGKEESVQLETTGASDQKYNLSFQVVQGLPPSDPVTMSWGTIEKIRDKTYGTPPIDNILFEITRYSKSLEHQNSFSTGSRQKSKVWPFIKEDVNNIEWTPSVQPRTDVQVRFVQYFPLCNTLCVEVVPWCLMINMTGATIIIKDDCTKMENNESTAFQISNNSVFVPPTAIVTSTFQIGLMDDDGKEWLGPPMQMTSQQWSFKRRSVLMPALEGMIPVEGITHTHIICGGQICYLTIQSHDENGIRIVNIKPTFKISNCLEETITVASISSAKKEIPRQDYANFLGQEISSCSNDIIKEGMRADPLLYWQILDISDDIYAHGFQEVAFLISECWSTALNLGNCTELEHDVRISVSLPKSGAKANEDGDSNDIANELIFVTLHQRNGIVYLVIQADKQPQYIVHNGTSPPICFIEQETGLNKYASSINHPKIIHKVDGLKSYLYSSVFASSNLSKVESMENAVQIAFSGISEKKVMEESDVLDQNLSWSEWFDISNTNKYLNEYFIRIPGYGDVSVYMEPNGNTSHIYIEPISDSEVPAKEIRNRFLASSPNTSVRKQLSPDFRSKTISPQLISLPTSPAASDTSELVDTSTNGDESFVTIPALDKSRHIEDRSFQSIKSPVSTVYGSCDNSLAQRTTYHSVRNEFYGTAFFDEISFVLRYFYE